MGLWKAGVGGTKRRLPLSTLHACVLLLHEIYVEDKVLALKKNLKLDMQTPDQPVLPHVGRRFSLSDRI